MRDPFLISRRHLRINHVRIYRDPLVLQTYTGICLRTSQALNIYVFMRTKQKRYHRPRAPVLYIWNLAWVTRKTFGTNVSAQEKQLLTMCIFSLSQKVGQPVYPYCLFVLFFVSLLCLFWLVYCALFLWGRSYRALGLFFIAGWSENYTDQTHRDAFYRTRRQLIPIPTEKHRHKLWKIWGLLFGFSAVTKKKPEKILTSNAVFSQMKTQPPVRLLLISNICSWRHLK